MLDVIQLKKPNFNAYKSAIYSKLLVYHNILISTEGNYGKFAEKIKSLIVAILENTHNKQSLFMEIKKYFIYLDENARKEILNKFNYSELINKENIQEDEKEK